MLEIMDNGKVKDVEAFFLNTLLRISIAGSIFSFVVDIIVITADKLSLSMDFAVIFSCLSAYFIRKKQPVVCVLVLNFIILAAITYQSTEILIHTASMATILVVGFTFSVMLKGRLMLAMHVVTIVCIAFIFLFQLYLPEMNNENKKNELISAAVSFYILYFILTYATQTLKASYDKAQEYLRETNTELVHKTNEIEAQNEELVQIQENLNELNQNLENRINERTAKIQIQNEILTKYSFANAHHLRGPVARLLGLASIQKTDSKIDPQVIAEMMVEQAIEIDAVIKQIKLELESNEVGI
jgi:signal transduction histidine kinase